MNAFQKLGLDADLLKAIEDMGFETPSEVQEKSIPILLEQETDLVSLAQTGTGKTAAFGFPLIQKIDSNSKKTQALILSPTRELCLQITNELKNYSKYKKSLNVVAVYGGASITDQARAIERGAQIIVATPGRMQDMIRRRMANISSIGYCVLDEADEMLNMGFYEDIKSILSHTPQEKKTWLFSATMPKEVAKIAKKFMTNPVEITVGSKNMGTSNVSHEWYLVNHRNRYDALKRLADANPDIFSVIFCRTKRDTQKVAEKLIEDGYNAAALHGDLSQNQRDLVMKSFRSRQIQMLVATDVAARGIDVDDITHVINYQLPDEIETYTHRSGRTGRAGKNGVSMVIISKSEVRKIRTIEKIIQQKFEEKQIPDGKEICKTQLFHLANDIKKTEINHDIDPYLPTINEALEDFTKEELIKKFFSVEFTRFFNYYQKAPDLNSESAGGRPQVSEGNTRYFINVGSKDGYDWKSLKDFLTEELNLDRDDVFKVDCKASFSFFNTDEKHTDLILKTFTEYKQNGRFVNVEVTKDQQSGRGGGGRKRERGGGGGGRRNSKSFDDNKGGKFSGRRRSEKRDDKGPRKGSRNKNIENSIKRRRSKA
ncbi:ATP-dependent RNA helicase DeaD [Christiangramia gaetbulicola]|uniref:RNA helicase n=1 Tax=Christiangramia gaetbulicola TaxID=703340 RepID=A0A2T6AHJ5_9FLAO|nr:DEAD/DEAH box helicase [Christiangramia gaetbulicola]PTX43279.1 ATP-dependent RNA helicase DeaD [Christiangramia gaetbulicola]